MKHRPYIERVQHAHQFGEYCDRTFAERCRALGLDPEEAIKDPLTAIEAQQVLVEEERSS